MQQVVIAVVVVVVTVTANVESICDTPSIAYTLSFNLPNKALR